MAQEIGIILSLEGVQKFTANFTEAISKIGTFAGAIDEVIKRISGLQRDLQGSDNENLITKYRLEDSILKLGSARVALDGLGATIRQVNTDIANSSEPKTFTQLAKAIGLTSEQAREFLEEFTKVDGVSKNAANGLDEAAKKAAETSAALQNISLTDVEGIDFTTLANNMQKLAIGLDSLGEVATKYKDAIAADIFNLINQFNKVNPARIEDISNQIGAIVTFFKGLSEETQGVDLSKFSEIIQPILVLSTVKLGPIKQSLKLEKEFNKFFTVLGSLKPAMVKNLDNLIVALLKIEALDVPPNVSKSLTELTTSLSGFVKRISGKFIATNIDITIQAFDKFIDVVARLGTSGPNPADDALYDLYTKFNLLTNVIGPLASLVAAFGTSFEPLVLHITELSRALASIAKVSASELKAALEANVNVLVNFATALTTGVPDVNLFVKNLALMTTGLREFASAITSISSRDSITKFASQVGTLVGAFNRLAKQIDVKDFLTTITPFTKELQNLADVINGLNRVVGKGTLANLVAFNLTQEQQKLQDAKNAAAALALQNKALRNNEKALAKAAKEAAKAAEKQRELNASYAIDKLSKSTNAIDRYIGRLIELRREQKKTSEEIIKEFGKDIRTQFIVKVEVLGIKAFTRLISLLTLGPVKVVIALTKAFFGLANIIGNLGITTTINSIIRFGKSIASLITYIGKLAKSLALLVFNNIAQEIKILFNILKILLSPFKLLFNIFISIIKVTVFLTKNLFGLVNVFKLLLAPINALISLMSRLNSLFAGKKKTAGPSIDTASSVESFNQLDNAATKAYTNIAKESDKVTNSQNEIQSEFKETALASKQVDTVKQSLTGLQKVADTINISKTFVFGDNISKLLLGVAALTVSFKALQKVGQMLTQTFQRFSYVLRGLVTDAFDASAEYERLQLTLQSLQKRELVKEGLLNLDGSLAQAAQLSTIIDTIQTNGDIFLPISSGIDLVSKRSEELLQWMRALAIQSPFNLEDIANTVKLGQTYGFTTEEAKILTQSVIDLAAATGQTGETGEGIIRALGQIRANSKLAKEELNQLAERGVPAIEYLADALTGGDAAALLAAVTDGAVSAEVAIKVLSNAIQRDFGGAAALQTQTLSGLLATIQDLRRNILRELATPIFDIFKPLVAQFATIDSINNLLDTAKQYGELLADKVAVGVTYVVQALATLKVFFEAIPESTKENIKQFIKFIAATSAVSVALFGLITVLTKSSIVFFALVNPISALVVVLFKFRTSVFNVFKSISAVFQSFINAVNTMYNAIKPGLDLVYNGFTQLLNRISTLLTSFVNTIFTYGANIGISFANGFASAQNYILQQLFVFADLIAYWLAPGSPPRILPDIDEWGTAAANEFLGGFSQSDFSAIEDFGSTIEDLIKALELPEGTIDINDIQKDYAELINTFNSGDISDNAIQEFFSEIRKETGAASEDFVNVASQYVVLASEQARLNAATEEYNKQLKETNSQLEALEQQSTMLDQKQQLEEITRILNNRYATTAKKEQAELQRKKILAEQAKAEIENQQKNVEAQKENINLLKKRIGLDAAQSEDSATTRGASGGSDAAEKVKKLKEEAGKLGESLNTALTPLTNIRDTLAEIKPPKVNFAEIWQKATEDAKKKVDELKDSFAQLGATLNIVKFAAIGVVGALLAPTIIRNITALATGVSTLAKALAPIAAIGLGGAAVIALLAGGLLLLAALKPTLLTDIGNALLGFGLKAWTAIQLIGTNIKDNIKKNILDPFNDAFAVQHPLFDERNFAKRILDGIIASLNSVGTAVTTAVTTFIAEKITNPFTSGFNSTNEEEGIGIGQKILDGINKTFEGLGTKISDFIKSSVTLTEIDTAIREKIKLIDFSGTTEELTQSIKDVIEKSITDAISPENFSVSIDLSKILTFAGFDSEVVLQSIKTSFDNFKAAIPISLLNSFNIIWKSFVDNLTESDIPAKLAEFSRLLGEIGGKALRLVGAILGLIGVIVGSIIAELPTLFSGVLDVLIGIGDVVLGIFEEGFGGIQRIFQGLYSILSGIGAFGEFIINTLINVGVALAGIAGFEIDPAGIQTFRDAVADAVDLILSFWKAIGDGLVSFYTAIQGTNEAFNDWWEGFTGFETPGAWWNDLVLDITNSLNDGYNNIVNWVSNVRTQFNTFKTVITNPFALAEIAITNFSTKLETVIDVITTILGVSLPTPFTEAFFTGLDNVATAVGNLRDAFTTISNPDLIVISPQPFIDLFNAVVPIPDIINSLKDLFNNLTISDPFAPLIVTFNFLLSGPESLIDGLNSLLAYVTDYQIPNPFTIMKDTLESIPTFLDSLQTKFTSFSDFIGSIEIPNPLAVLQEGIETASGWLDFRGAKEDAETGGKEVAKSVATSTETELNNSKVTIKSDFVEVNATDFEASGKPITQGVVKGVEDESNSTESRNAFQRAGDNLQGLWNSVWDTNSPSTVARDEMGLPIAQGVIEGIETGFEDVAFEGSTSAITSAFNTYSDEMGPELGKSFAAKIIDGMRLAFAELDLGSAITSGTDESASPLQSILSFDTETIAALIEQFNGLFTAIIEALEEFVEEFSEIFVTFLEDTVELLEETIDAVVEIVQDMFAQIIEMLVAFAIQVLQILNKLMNDIKNIMKQFAQIMKDAARAGINAFLEELKGFGEKIKTAIINSFVEADLENILKEQGKTFGKAIADGMEAAIMDSIPSLVDAVKAFLAAAIKALDEGVKPGSPSKVVYKEYGVPFADGLITGILDGVPRVASAAKELADTAMNGLKDINSELALTVPIYTEYIGLKNSLPDLNQNIRLNKNGMNYDTGIAGMQSATGATVINNNQNYIMNVTVKDTQVTNVRRNFAKMQQLRV